MKISRINLAEHYSLDTEAYVDILQPTALLDRGAIDDLPLLLICPGGGYGMVSKREGEPVALEFLARGYVTAILTYSTITTSSHSRYPTQLNELMSAVDYLLSNSEKYGFSAKKLFVMGFSAGGHLVCNLGVEYPKYLSQYKLDIRGVCLCYPVISSEYGFSGNTYVNLLNGYSEEEKQVKMGELSFNCSNLERFPPTFIWTTNGDELVSPLNSISFAERLAQYRRPCEFHMFLGGPHGMSTCSELINAPIPQLKQAEKWMDMCNAFFKSLL